MKLGISGYSSVVEHLLVMHEAQVSSLESMNKKVNNINSENLAFQNVLSCQATCSLVCQNGF